MSTWSTGVYTNKGLALLAKLTQGANFKITKVTVGTGYVNESLLPQQTEITGEKQELDCLLPSYPSVGKCKLPVKLSNEKVTTSYKAHSLGVYVNDPDEGEILYFIAQSQNGTDILSNFELPGYTATWTLYFSYGQAKDVEVTVDPSNAATQAELKEVIDIIEAGIAPKVKGESTISIDNTANLPFAGLNIYGKSTQDGVPTPNSPIPIKNYVESGSVKVGVCGKNLLPQDILSNSSVLNGVTCTKNSDGSVTVVGTATSTAVFGLTNNAHVENGKKYILSGCPSGGKTGQTFVLRCYNYNGQQVVADDEGNGKEILFTNADGEYNFAVVVASGATVNETFYPMLRSVEIKDGTYEPYKLTTVSIEVPKLNGVPVTTNDNYNYIDDNGVKWFADELDLVRGVFIQRVHEFTPTTIKDSITVLGNTVRFDVKLPFKAPYKTSSGKVCGHGVCTHVPFMDSYSKDEVHFYTQADTGWLFIPKECGTTASELANWLSENQISIFYQLETPIETSLTDTELKVCQTLVSNNPVTTVMNDSNLYMTIECVGTENEDIFDMVFQNVQNNLIEPALKEAKSYTDEELQSLLESSKETLETIELLQQLLSENENVLTTLNDAITQKLGKNENAVSATKLQTARKLKVALGSTTDVTFDGTADRTNIPVSGTLPVANGGTGQTTLQALRNAMGLGNTTGALPVANGGTGATNASTARTNLGAAPIDSPRFYTKMEFDSSSNASGNDSVALGRFSVASGNDSVALGYSAKASGSHSFAIQMGNASGDCSIALGRGTISSNYSGLSVGKANKTPTTGGSFSNKTGDAFIIGNGTANDDSYKSNAFRVTYGGVVYGLSAYNASGADYAEFFEWLDGNPDDEDRVGYFVAMDGENIRIANASDDYILGIVSGNPCLVGNSDEDWLGRWEMDEFNRFIKEPAPKVIQEEIKTPILDENGEETGEYTIEFKETEVVGEYEGWRYKANPNYDPSLTYIERKDRQEWDYVGMLGVLAVRDDGTCQVNGFCQVADGGIATHAEKYIAGQTYRVIERVTDNIIKVVFK